MQKELEKICAEGLLFFGKSNRLISHELKNIIAIISETLGLLHELAELSESGMRLTPEKLREMSGSILEEVDRANAVIRCMNRFAHSVDEFVGDVDLGQIVSLSVQLVKLNPVSKTVMIEFLEGGSYKIHTSPFFLGNLLYHAFYFALSAAAPEKHIKVSIPVDGRRVGVDISGVAPDGFKSFPTPQAQLLVKILGAEILSDGSSGKFQVLLPRKMTQGPAVALSARQSGG